MNDDRTHDTSERLRYEASVARIDEHQGWRFVRRRILPGSSVLDVGCGSGGLAQCLGRLPGFVDGIEPNAERAEQASTRCRRVAVGVAGPDVEAELESAYDTVVLTDVVEHVVDPEPLLRWCAQRLKPGGEVIAIIPNSACWEFRRQMLRGDWTYAEVGYFDRDHVRFYDTKTARRLGVNAELVEREVWFAPARLPRPLDKAVRGSRWACDRWPNLFAAHSCIAWSAA